MHQGRVDPPDGEARSNLRYGMFLGRLAPALAQAGRVAEGLAAVEEALAWAERSDERWAIAELLRITESFCCCRAHKELCRPRTFPASARLGMPTRRPLLGTAGHREPCPAAARSGPLRRCDGTPSVGLQPLHRRVR